MRTLPSIFLLASLFLGCTTTPATQLLVVVDSDVEQGCFGLVVSRLDAAGAVEPDADRRILNITQVPFSFGVATPSGDANARVQVSVELLADCMDPLPNAPRIQRTVRTGFIRNHTLRLPLVVQASCVMCREPATCSEVSTQCEPIADITLTERDAVIPGMELNTPDAMRTDAGVSP